MSLPRVDTHGEKVRPDCRGAGGQAEPASPCDALLLMRVSIPLFPLGWHLLSQAGDGGGALRAP